MMTAVHALADLDIPAALPMLLYLIKTEYESKHAEMGLRKLSLTVTTVQP